MSMFRRAEKVGRKFQNPVPTAVGGLGLGLKLLPQFLANREERAPRTPLGPFLTDASVLKTPPASGLRVTWLGHSSMLVEIDGVRILIDPVWDERASPVQWAGPKRFFAPPLSLEYLQRIDVVLVSHDHYDHLGAGTVRRLAELPAAAKARWITSLGVGAVLRKFGVHAEKITEMNWTDTVQVAAPDGAECEITSLPSRHFSGRGVSRFETLWASFVVRGTHHRVYFGGDSGWWDGFAGIGAEYGPFDLTMLEIGAYNELWKHIHLGPDAAVRAFQAMGGSGLMMPIHWGLFDLALHAWRQPIERLYEIAKTDGLKLWSPAPGVPTEVVRGVEVRADWWRT